MKKYFYSYCAWQYGVERHLEILMYEKYIPASRRLSPCLAFARDALKRFL